MPLPRDLHLCKADEICYLYLSPQGRTQAGYPVRADWRAEYIKELGDTDVPGSEVHDRVTHRPLLWYNAGSIRELLKLDGERPMSGMDEDELMQLTREFGDPNMYER